MNNRKAFRATIDIVVDFNEDCTEDKIKTILQNKKLTWDSHIIIRELQSADIPADAKPLVDYTVRCYTCNKDSLRTTARPWCPSPEVGTLYTCQSCQTKRDAELKILNKGKL